jgi:hypothetical protein
MLYTHQMLVDACPRLESVGTYGPHLTTDEKLADLASARWSTLNLTFWRGAAVTSQVTPHAIHDTTRTAAQS